MTTSEIARLEAGTRADFAKLEKVTASEIARLELTTAAQIAKLEKEVVVVKCMIGLVIVTVVIPLVRPFFG